MTHGERIAVLEAHRQHDRPLLQEMDNRLGTVEGMVADIHRGFRAFIWIAKGVAALGMLVAFAKGVVSWQEVSDEFKDLA